MRLEQKELLQGIEGSVCQRAADSTLFFFLAEILWTTATFVVGMTTSLCMFSLAANAALAVVLRWSAGSSRFSTASGGCWRRSSTSSLPMARWIHLERRRRRRRDRTKKTLTRCKRINDRERLIHQTQATPAKTPRVGLS